MHQIKLTPEQVREGMFVAELDRPWLDSPFPFQGFKVTSKAQIRKLRDLCIFVYIDTDKGIPPPTKPGHDWSNITERLPADIPPAPLPIHDLVHYEIDMALEDEISAAIEIHDTLTEELHTFMDAVDTGNKPTLQPLTGIILEMRESMIRNPHAFLYLSRLKTRDKYTYAHAIQCGTFAMAFGRHLGLKQGQLYELALGALLMDVGKLTLPAKLLSKESPLSIEEFEVCKQHVAFSLSVLEGTGDVPPMTMEMVASHHERFNGTGYPAGLKGGQISLYARIAGIVDFFAAVTNARPFAAPMSPHDAIMHLYEFRNSLFQSELIEYFIQSMGAFPVGTLVDMSNGETGIVISQNEFLRLKPQVLVILDAAKQPLEICPIRDLVNAVDEISGDPLKIVKALPPGTHGIEPADFYL